MIHKKILWKHTRLRKNDENHYLIRMHVFILFFLGFYLFRRPVSLCYNFVSSLTDAHNCTMWINEHVYFIANKYYSEHLDTPSATHFMVGSVLRVLFIYWFAFVLCLSGLFIPDCPFGLRLCSSLQSLMTKIEIYFDYDIVFRKKINKP